MTHYTIYIRASNDTQESAHQRNAIEKWLSDHDLDFKNVDQFGDLGQSGAESGRELFIDLVDAIQSEDYEYVVSEISRLARLGSICQPLFNCCKDTGTTVAITNGWIDEIRPDGTGRLIANIPPRSERKNAAASPSVSRSVSIDPNERTKGLELIRKVSGATTTAIFR